MRPGDYGRGHRWLVVKGIAVLLAFVSAMVSGACVSPARLPQPESSPKTGETSPPVSVVSVGLGSGTVAVNAFLPEKITVPLGSTVTWRVASEEVHSLTILSKTIPAVSEGAYSWQANAVSGSSIRFEDNGFLHSGILKRDDFISVTFPKTGRYLYICALHRGMEGEVQVAQPGEGYTTVEAAATLADAEREILLSRIDEIRVAAKAQIRGLPQSDGTTTWAVMAGAKASRPTGYVELYEYFPSVTTIKAGDTVKWIAARPHTVTFLSGEPRPDGPPETWPARTSQKTYSGIGVYHSGILADGPNAPSEYELRFPTPGTYPYICLLHGSLGHIGAVRVE